MDNFKPNFKTPPSATNPTPNVRPGQPVHGGKNPNPSTPGGWQKPAQPKK